MDIQGDIFNTVAENIPLLFRLLVSVICGAVIGIERMIRNKEAGIRTHIIVALGSALMTIISKYGFFDIGSIAGAGYDASRIAANIITGISFLGSGMIIYKGTVKGLTTAAGIWATSGIGMAIGSGMYYIGIISTVLLLLIQIIIHRFLPIENTTVFDLSVKIKDEPGVLDSLYSGLKEYGCDVINCNMEKGDGVINCTFNVRSRKNLTFDKIQQIFSGYDYILSISYNI